MELISIGKIVKPQGVKGEVKIQLFTDNFAALKQIKEVFLSNEKQARKVKTVSVRFGFAYLLFEGVEDRNLAETLRGKEISVEKEKMVITEPDSFYIEDIIGSIVYDENNKEIGVLVDIEQYGAADVWIVRSEGREYSFPYVGDIVKKVLPEQKIIIINKKRFDESKICE